MCSDHAGWALKRSPGVLSDWVPDGRVLVTQWGAERLPRESKAAPRGGASASAAEAQNGCHWATLVPQSRTHTTERIRSGALNL